MAQVIEFFEVGGSVRDSLLGRYSKDIDYVVIAPSYEEMRRAILARGVRLFLEKPEYYTLRGHHPKGVAVDYVWARKSVQGVEAGTLYDDLARRDFTCNAIARNPDTGVVIDPFDGARACRERVLQGVGDAYERFSESASRMVRALRFMVTLEFTPSVTLVDAMHERVRRLGDLALAGASAEVVRDELYKACQANWLKTLELLAKYGLMPAVQRLGVNFTASLK